MAMEVGDNHDYAGTLGISRFQGFMRLPIGKLFQP
jgi:hypothetical protein